MKRSTAKGNADAGQSPAKRGGGSRKLNYRVPKIWHCWETDCPVQNLGKELAVEPVSYTRACLDWIRDHATVQGDVAGRSLSRIQGVKTAGPLRVKDGRSTRRAGDWINGQIMYGMMIRTSTAWDHDGDGRLAGRRFNELGTFLKSILLLPHLRRLGVSVLYLLPVVKVSHLYRKGELGCPYAAKDFFELDPDQYEARLEEEFGDADAQFALLVESAHRLGMRVMLDIAPRTTARDSDWILENPRWYYWIDRREERGYRAPIIPGATYINPIPGRLGEMYGCSAVREHLGKFRFAPSVTHPREWAEFAKKAKADPPKNLLAEIGRRFGVITPPGFSDVVNDRQPPWSDVTYLRLFEDHPVESARHLPNPAEQPPYVLYDTAKASLFEGRKRNERLWDRLIEVIPHYQRFGVDGARVDMAHALPHELERMILERPRELDPDFCFLAEELGAENHARAHRRGYNIIIGPSWWMQPRAHEGKMHELLEKLPGLRVPVMAAAETPDTPRAAVRKGKRKFSMQAAVLNNFLPNAVPMITSGMEVFERQPMNLGLDAREADRRALPADDPFAGKLAFFDRFAMHWNNAGGARMVELMAQAAALRRQFLKTLTRKRAYFEPRVASSRKWVLATGFRLVGGKGVLLMVANLDCAKKRRTAITDLWMREIEVLLQIHDSPLPTLKRGKLRFSLAPGEVMVVRG